MIKLAPGMYCGGVDLLEPVTDFTTTEIFGCKLKKDVEYKAIVYGWRIPFMSTYRNILAVTPVEKL